MKPLPARRRRGFPLPLGGEGRGEWEDHVQSTLRASVLVGLLWCVAILSVVVIGVLHSAHVDLMLVKNHGDMIQAHYLALAGVEKAKGLLYHDASARKRAALGQHIQTGILPDKLQPAAAVLRGKNGSSPRIFQYPFGLAVAIQVDGIR